MIARFVVALHVGYTPSPSTPTPSPDSSSANQRAPLLNAELVSQTFSEQNSEGRQIRLAVVLVVPVLCGAIKLVVVLFLLSKSNIICRFVSSRFSVLHGILYIFYVLPFVLSNVFIN